MANSGDEVLVDVLKDTVSEFMEDKALRLAAALAYYSIFSLAPLLIIIIALAGFFLDQSTVRQQVHDQLSELLGPQSIQTIESMTAARKVGSTTIATILGIGALLLGAAGALRTTSGRVEHYLGGQSEAG